MTRTEPFWKPNRPMLSYGILGAILVGLVLVAMGGCQAEESSQAEAAPTPPAYQIETGLTDSSLAVVVRSAYRTDTMKADSFRMQARRIRQQQQRRGAPSKPSLTTPPDRARPPVARQVLDPFVTRHVMWGAAAVRDIPVDSARLERSMERIRSQYESAPAFRRAVQKRGLTVDSVRVQEATKLRAEQLWETMAGRATPPSDSAVRAYRQAQQQDKVQFRHILFPLPSEASDAEVDSVEARAHAVLDSIRNGRSFATMARRHSAAASASLGGRRRAVPVAQLKASVAEALAPLRRPDALVDAPVTTEQGVHLLQLVRRNEDAGMSRGEAKWSLLSKRREEAVEQALRSLKKKVVVQINPSVVPTDWRPE